jgi:hypothetical protein
LRFIFERENANMQVFTASTPVKLNRINLKTKERTHALLQREATGRLLVKIGAYVQGLPKGSEILRDKREKGKS